MRLCVFEDSRVEWLEPLTLTRPTFALRCGAATLLERQQRACPGETGCLVRPELAALCRLQHPQLAVNDPAWLNRPGTLLVNARWLPPPGPLPDLDSPRVGLCGEEVAYVVLPRRVAVDCGAEAIEDWVGAWKERLPVVPAAGTLVGYAWDLVEANAQALAEDFSWRRQAADSSSHRASPTVVGPAEQLLVHPDAAVEPFVVADTRGGPVLVDRGAVVHSFSRLEGPCWVGPESWILGARLRGASVGPNCRVGGEVEASILHGCANKYHDGFLGHSYVGEWVNLGAGTQVSDLRSDYGEVTLTVAGERVASGLTKVGAFLGDHTKTGLNTLLNTGTVVGAFCGLLPTGTFLPRVIPSFCSCLHGQLQERWELWDLFRTAATVMRRRGAALTETHTDFYFTLFDRTAPARRQLVGDGEVNHRTAKRPRP